MTEGGLLKKFLLEYSRLGLRLFRNNVGKPWSGKRIGPFKETKTITVNKGDVLLKNARPFHAGLVKGSSDLIGWSTMLITPHMVGKKVAVFTACEVKTKNMKPTKEQTAFVRAVNNQGGIGVIAYDIEDLLKVLTQFKNGDNSNESRH